MQMRPTCFSGGWQLLVARESERLCRYGMFWATLETCLLWWRPRIGGQAETRLGQRS